MRPDGEDPQAPAADQDGPEAGPGEAREGEPATVVMGVDEGGDEERIARGIPATVVMGAEGRTGEGAPPPVDVEARTEHLASAATVLPERSQPESRPGAPGASRAGRRDAAGGIEPGTVLFGEYEIVNVLGAGGMGDVYRARHRRLDEFRAIKVMRAEISRNADAREFFYREAKALISVRHPAVVHCHDLLSDDAGHVYLVMEMIDGIALSDKIREGPLSADEVAILGARVSHGLAAAHAQGVIHRDVSPDNIVLPNGRVEEAKLIDFGIAKILEQGEGTIADGFKGKLSYASPEQLGFFGGQIDGRSDLYSLGLVLVAAALGRPLGMGNTLVTAVDARRSLRSLPDEIPVGLRSAILPLLAMDPNDRPRRVDRLFVAPGELAGAEPVGYSAPTRVPAGGVESSVGSRAGLIAAAVGTLAVVGAGSWLWLSNGAAGPALEDASPAPSVVTPPTTAGAATEAAAPKATVGRRLGASDRIRIIGLLNNAKLALAQNRLMSPAGDNAYERYRGVLEIDPENAQARDGLRAVAGRYLALADASFGKGDASQARDYVARAREADVTHPDLTAMEARIGR